MCEYLIRENDVYFELVSDMNLDSKNNVRYQCYPRNKSCGLFNHCGYIFMFHNGNIQIKQHFTQNKLYIY